MQQWPLPSSKVLFLPPHFPLALRSCVGTMLGSTAADSQPCNMQAKRHMQLSPLLSLLLYHHDRRGDLTCSKRVVRLGSGGLQSQATTMV
jgi:hypothetical protein